MVPRAGIEPARCCHRGILSPLRLPISPPGRTANERIYRRGRIKLSSIWRLRAESNRRTRLCRPLHNHSATQPLSEKTRLKCEKPRLDHRGFYTALIWSGKPDSNWRPQPWQGCALPTELFPLVSSSYFIGGQVTVKHHLPDLALESPKVSARPPVDIPASTIMSARQQYTAR